MRFRDRLLEMRWTLGRQWFGVWEVRDYYTTLEQRAKAGAEITFGYILMVLVSAALATGGLLLSNPAVVIGSICVAPFLGPSRAVCIGGLFRNRELLLGAWSSNDVLYHLHSAHLEVNVPALCKANANRPLELFSLLIAAR